jgi:hypothetical protein
MLTEPDQSRNQRRQTMDQMVTRKEKDASHDSMQRHR